VVQNHPKSDVIMEYLQNKNAFTPHFISSILQSVEHRFIYVMECETRQYDENALRSGHVKQKYTPPRFSIASGPAGPVRDPRTVNVQELVPANVFDIPENWEKLHQYVYLLLTSTDEHGWQYRSDWSHGVLEPHDEQWVPENREGLDVRRRLWFITLSAKDDATKCKQILTEAIRRHPRGIIMRGELSRMEKGAIGLTSWTKRHVVLKDDRLEFYTTDKMDKRVGSEYYIKDCLCKMLFGSQCPDRQYAFSVRSTDSSIGILLDANNREMRRRWVVAISYQLAILHRELNFPAFDYGPPTGDEALDRVLTCGELAKQGHVVKNWKNRFFKLTPRALEYYEKETLKGFINIQGATLKSSPESLEFEVQSNDGHILIMRADSAKTRDHWIDTIKRLLLEQAKRAETVQVLSETQILYDFKDEAAKLRQQEEIEQERKRLEEEENQLAAEEAERQLRKEEERNVRLALEAASIESVPTESTSARESTAFESIVTEFHYEEPAAATTTETSSTGTDVDAGVTVITNADVNEFQDIVDDNTGFSNANDESSGAMAGKRAQFLGKSGFQTVRGATAEIDTRRQSTNAKDMAKRFESLIKDQTTEVESKPWVGKRSSVMSPPK